MRKHPILNWIESNVSDTILSRGRSYVGNVSKLKYDEDTETWTAQVVGSDVYDVEISTDEEDEFYAECDCPYDWEENCKHIVAVALKIAEEGVEETKSTTKIKSILAETKYLLPVSSVSGKPSEASCIAVSIAIAESKLLLSMCVFSFF